MYGINFKAVSVEFSLLENPVQYIGLEFLYKMI